MQTVTTPTFKSYPTPTGHICVMNGSLGKPLEFLSLGDYGKEKNIKADFMGLTREINGVPHGDLLPLEEKWVITISSQYGCSMGCKFCDVPQVGPGENATAYDMIAQVYNALSLHPEVKHAKRINLHFARMGEPTFNSANVFQAVHVLADMFAAIGWGFHPVISTMMPKYHRDMQWCISEWLRIKNVILKGNAGLQLSINTTDEYERGQTMPMAAPLYWVSKLFDTVIAGKAQAGRKIALNFALTDAPIDAVYLRSLFDPQYFMCKITPMHNTTTATANGLVTRDGYDSYYPYQAAEQALKEQGFDVIVFIPSKEEDESRITCGNAILADKKEDNA